MFVYVDRNQFTTDQRRSIFADLSQLIMVFSQIGGTTDRDWLSLIAVLLPSRCTKVALQTETDWMVKYLVPDFEETFSMAMKMQANYTRWE